MEFGCSRTFFAASGTRLGIVLSSAHRLSSDCDVYNLVVIISTIALAVQIANRTSDYDSRGRLGT